MKNERAIIMSLTYVIGFTTALITYGISTDMVSVATNDVPLASTEQTANVIAARDQKTATPASDPKVTINEAADGLYLVVDGESVLVSPDAAKHPELADTGHYAVYATALSDDERLLFFCAATTPAAENCEPRMFDRDAFGIRQVTLNGQSLSLPIADVNAAWRGMNVLALNGYTSTAAKPWVLD